VKLLLALWRTVTKSTTSALFALALVTAAILIIYIVTARTYSLRMQWGSDKRFELTPAGTQESASRR
jgi:hypothetical protein